MIVGALGRRVIVGALGRRVIEMLLRTLGVGRRVMLLIVLRAPGLRRDSKEWDDRPKRGDRRDEVMVLTLGRLRRLVDVNVVRGRLAVGLVRRTVTLREDRCTVALRLGPASAGTAIPATRKVQMTSPIPRRRSRCRLMTALPKFRTIGDMFSRRK